MGLATALHNLTRPMRALYRRMREPEVDAELRAVMDLLARTAIFRDLPRGVLHEVAEIVHRRRYKRDQVIYYRDDPGLGLYVIEEGQVELYVESPGDQLHDLGVVGPGEVFGLLAMVGDFPRLETVRARTDVIVLGLFLPDVRVLVKRDPRSGVALLQAVAEHLGAQYVGYVEVLRNQLDPDQATHLRTAAQQHGSELAATATDHPL